MYVMQGRKERKMERKAKKEKGGEKMKGILKRYTWQNKLM